MRKRPPEWTEFGDEPDPEAALQAGDLQAALTGFATREMLDYRADGRCHSDGWICGFGVVQWLIVGADRICANGDTANKIGTYAHAISARHHGVKVMVVAPASTVDMATARGEDIHIEERDGAELLSMSGVRTVADGVAAFNPVFDVTPAGLIDALVTERGVIVQPDGEKMAAMFGPVSRA